MTQKHATLLLLFISLTISVFAQKRTFDDVLEVRLQNIGTVYQGTMVKGYFMLYFIDRTDDFYKSNFRLVILDEDLNKVTEKSLVEQNDAEILAMRYNGASLMAEFYSPKWGELEVRHYDLTLKLIDKQLYGLNSLMKYKSDRENIVAIEKKGFVYYFSDDKYSMEFFPVKGIKGWKSKTKDSDITKSRYLAHTDSLLLNTVTKKWVRHSQPAATFLQGIDLATGKMVFEKEIPMADYELRPLHAFRDSDGNFVVSGNYINFNDDGVLGRSKCKGFFNVKISEKGEILSQNVIPLEKAATDKVAIDSKGKINEKYDLFIHDAAYTKDGSVYFIGELYNSKTYYNLQDLFVVKIGPDMKTAEAKIFDAPNMNNQKFSFQFLEESDDASEFSFLYKSVETKEKAKQENTMVQSARAGEPAYTQDKLVTNSAADFSKVLPAKYGNVFLIDYFKKEKKIDTRIEKFNH